MKKKLSVRLTARFRGNPVFASLLQHTGRSIKNKRWIFIVGCYNSGTTLLDDILSRHPQISGLGDEGVMLTNQLPRPEDFGWRRMWWKCEDQVRVLDKPAQRAMILKKQWSHFVDLSKPYLLEKSIANTARCLFFEKHFEVPYFIHLVRNGYAVAEGIQRKAKVMESCPLWPKQQYDMDYCINQWKRSLEVIEMDRPHLTNFLEVSYENLTENPAATLNSITDYLGLSRFSDAMAQGNFSIHEKESRIENMNASNMARLTANDIQCMNAIAGEMLKKYGYLMPG